MKAFKMGLGIVAQCLALGSGFHHSIGHKTKQNKKTEEAANLSRSTGENPISSLPLEEQAQPWVGWSLNVQTQQPLPVTGTAGSDSGLSKCARWLTAQGALKEAEIEAL